MHTHAAIGERHPFRRAITFGILLQWARSPLQGGQRVTCVWSLRQSSSAAPRGQCFWGLLSVAFHFAMRTWARLQLTPFCLFVVFLVLVLSLSLCVLSVSLSLPVCLSVCLSPSLHRLSPFPISKCGLMSRLSSVLWLIAGWWRRKLPQNVPVHLIPNLSKIFNWRTVWREVGGGEVAWEEGPGAFIREPYSCAFYDFLCDCLQQVQKCASNTNSQDLSLPSALGFRSRVRDSS